MIHMNDFFYNQEHLPFSFHLLNEKNYPMLWHKEIKIILVLVGSLNIELGKEVYTLKDKDFILINSNEGHSLTHISENSVVLSLKIDPLFYKNYYPKLFETYFDCKSFLIDSKNKKSEYIRYSIAKLLSIYYQNNDHYQFHLLKESLTLMEYLLLHFKKDHTNNVKSYEKYSHQRLRRIINFIDANYTQKITLSDVAKLEYISIHYLSKLFKSHLGIGFHEYLSQFRLNKSMKDLLTTNKNIIDIAFDNGFPNAKSYTKVFKKKYSIPPDEFRKKISSMNTLTPDDSFRLSKYSQKIIKQFIMEYEMNPNKHSLKTYSIEIDINKVLEKYNGFEKILYFNLKYDALNTNWQKNLKRIQKEIKFDYIRFSGIFTEGMYFYNKEESLYNWFHIDTLLDFFIENNLKPFIELYYTSKKFTLRRWHILLQNFLMHCINRYGLNEVQTWKFELASEDRSYEKSIDLYTKTLNIMEKNFQTLKFGILFVPARNFEDLHFLINFRNRNLDFMSVEMIHDVFIKKKELVKELLENIRKMNLKTYFINIKPIHYLNDTCFIASHLVNEILNDLKDANRQITFIDDLMSSKLFYGGYGILTYNGLKKPAYNAYHLLTKLKGVVLAKDKHYLVLRQNNKFQVLLYNFSEIRNHYKLTFEQYSSAKKALTDRTINIKLLLNLDKGKYKFTSHTLSSEKGCVFDAWVDIGSPDFLSQYDLEYLAYKEQIDLNIKIINIKQTLTIKELVCNDTIKLIEIEKI